MNIIITSPDSLTTPGGGVVGCLMIAEHLEKLGARVVLMPVATNGNEEKDKRMFSRVLPVRPNRFHYFLDGLSIRGGLEKLARVERIDAILAWQHEAAFIPSGKNMENIVFGMIAARPSYESWKKRKTRFKGNKNITDDFFRYQPLRRAEIIFSLSEFSRQELICLFDLPPEKVHVAHWGVGPAFSCAVRHSSEQLINFIFAGSLAEPKGIFDVIGALSKVKAQGYENWTLKIAGWGDEEQVRQAARNYQIGERLIFMGRLDHSVLIKEFMWAHLAILPSRVESFGLSIAEAQASGLPVVSYDACAIPEVVEDQVTGLLVPLGDIDKLANAIIRLVNNPKMANQFGANGRERIVKRFTWENTAKVILQNLEKVVLRRSIK